MKSSQVDAEQESKKSTRVLLIAIWYTSSIISSKLTYIQLKFLGNPIYLSLFQQTFVSVAGAIVLFTTRSISKHTNYSPLSSTISRSRSYYSSIAVLALAMTFMSISYNSAMLYIPVSFLNTIKSTIPIWTSAVCWFIDKRRFSFLTQISLVAIVGGVGLASATELGFHPFGFILGIFSAWNQTFFNIRAKTILMQDIVSPMQLQVFTAVISTVLLGSLCLVMGFGLEHQTQESAASVISTSSKHHPILLLTLSGLNYFAELRLSFAAIAALGSLGYSIADVFRRLILICSAVVIFGNPIQLSNIFGVCIAMVGILLYNLSVLTPAATIKTIPEWASKKKLELPPNSRSWSSPSSVLFAV